MRLQAVGFAPYFRIKIQIKLLSLAIYFQQALLQIVFNLAGNRFRPFFEQVLVESFQGSHQVFEFLYNGFCLVAFGYSVIWAE